MTTDMEDCECPADRPDETGASITCSEVREDTVYVRYVVEIPGHFATACVVHVPGGSGLGPRDNEVESCVPREKVPVPLL